MEWLDGMCDTIDSTCEGPPLGCYPDGRLTIDELRCNAFIEGLLTPDIDIDGDGRGDVIGFGWRFRAVPVTVLIE